MVSHMELRGAEMGKKGARSHILMLPLPAQGHITPLLHLCTSLASKGLKVTILNIESIHNQLLKQWQFPADLDISLEPLPFPFITPYGFDASCFEIEKEFFASLLVSLQDKLEKLVERFEAECPLCAIMVDYFMPLHCLTVARNKGLLGVLYFPGSASWSSVHYHCPFLYSSNDLPIPDSQLSAHCSTLIPIPGIPSLRPADLPSYFFQKNIKSDAESSFWIELSNAFSLADWVLVNSFYELEPQAFDAMREILGEKFISAGPFFPVIDARKRSWSLRSHDSKCLEWLQAKSEASVLYISFGSIATVSEQQFVQLTKGILKSKQPFMWVLRPEQSDKVSEEILQRFLQESSEQGILVSWAPQLEILCNTAVGAFLSHCGWNSILESICSGVPIIGFPCFSDQSLNCKLIVEDLKAGARFGKNGADIVEEEEVERVINMVMHGAEGRAIKQRMVKLKESAIAAAMEGGSSSDNLKASLAEISCNTLIV